MLARRLTIISLIVVIFGLGFSIVIAETSRPTRFGQAGRFIPCMFEHGLRCAAPRP